MKQRMVTQLSLTRPTGSKKHGSQAACAGEQTGSRENLPPSQVPHLQGQEANPGDRGSRVCRLSSCQCSDDGGESGQYFSKWFSQIKVFVADNYFTGSKVNIEQWIGHENFEMMHHDIVNPLFIEVRCSLNFWCAPFVSLSGG